MEINSVENSEFEQLEPKRPTLLLVLCILSGISIGFSLLGNVGAIFSGPLSDKALQETIAQSLKLFAKSADPNSAEFKEMSQNLILVQEGVNANFYVHHLVTLLALITGLVGVIQMFLGKKIGFHLYIIYSIISIFVIYLSVSLAAVSVFTTVSGVLLAGVFVYLYSRNLKWMN